MIENMKIDKVETKCGVRHYACHICAKDFLDSNIDQAVIDKIRFFHGMAQNFTYSQKW